MERDETQRARLLQEAFDRLPDELRDAVYLIRVEQLSFEEAGGRFGISAAEVERRVASALARLDRDLERLKWHQWRRW